MCSSTFRVVRDVLVPAERHCVLPHLFLPCSRVLTCFLLLNKLKGFDEPSKESLLGVKADISISEVFPQVAGSKEHIEYLPRRWSSMVKKRILLKEGPRAST